MDPITIGFLAIIAILVLIAFGIPIAMSLLSVSVVGMWALLGERPAMGLLSTVPYHSAASWTLSSVPMFLLMGFLAYHSGMTKGLFEAARAWLGWLPGGLAIASLFGAGGFATVTGSSVACSAAMGRIAVPEMHKSGYDLGFATGAIAAGGTLGALIPPSILLILYGIQAQVSITKLFLGGLILGGVTLVFYVALVLIVAKVKPQWMPRGPSMDRADRMAALYGVWPVALLVAIIFGSLFSGIFTATEAGAIGALATLLIGLGRRTMSWQNFRQSLIDTLLSSAGLFIITVAANAFTRLIALSGLSAEIGSWITALNASPFVLLLVISLVYIIIGLFLEPMGAMLLTLPITLPIVQSAGIDLIWFGILLAKLLEIGMITPPVGMNVFVIHSVARDLVKLEMIFRGVTLFILADLILVLLIIATRGWF